MQMSDQLHARGLYLPVLILTTGHTCSDPVQEQKPLWPLPLILDRRYWNQIIIPTEPSMDNKGHDLLMFLTSGLSVCEQ